MSCDSRKVIEAIQMARAVVILTGAGVSAESGIATFRDKAEGLWAKYNPEDLATPQAFKRDPQLVSRWYEWRMRSCENCKPNPGHDALAMWQDMVEEAGGRWTLLTQNVDRLHQQAGSRGVLELHGAVGVWRCCDCFSEEDAPSIPFESHPPCCKNCGGFLRPGVVWFGESLDAKVLEKAAEALSSCDLFVSIGTSSVVQPSASFIHVAAEAGAVTMEINLSSTPISNMVDHAVSGPSAEILAGWMASAFDNPG